MDAEQDQPAAVANPIPIELLGWLQLTGVVLQGSDDPVLRGWADHLLEDWRSLALLAQHYDEHFPV